MSYARAIRSIHDQPMWDSMRARAWSLQGCDGCGQYRYRPSSCCPGCPCMGHRWRPPSGAGTVLSWVVFHREYLPDHKPPCNAVAVQLAEGPVVVSNVVGPDPAGSWISQAVRVCYEPAAQGNLLPGVQLAAGKGAQA